MNNKVAQNWETEFREFLDSPAVEPSAATSEKATASIMAELQPSSLSVFGKLLAITTATGLASLTVCPQFGLGWGFGSWLMDFFMRFGSIGCSLGCGLLFMSLGVLTSCCLLRPEELRVLRQTRWLQLGALAMLALSAFVCAGAEILTLLTFLWIFGAILGSAAMLEAVYLFRFRLALRQGIL